MFISGDRFILKTCGVTTLLAAVPSLIELVQQKCNVSNVRVSTLMFSYGIWTEGYNCPVHCYSFYTVAIIYILYIFHPCRVMDFWLVVIEL